MRSWSMTAGRIFGVELRIHWTFFLLPLFVWYTEYSAHGTANEGRDLALVGIIFGSVLAHELGHALVAQRSGLRAKSIILLPIGGITQLEDSQAQLDPATSEPASDQPLPDPPTSNLKSARVTPWKRDIRIAMAGPLTNIFIALASAVTILLVAP